MHLDSGRRASGVTCCVRPVEPVASLSAFSFLTFSSQTSHFPLPSHLFSKLPIMNFNAHALLASITHAVSQLTSCCLPNPTLYINQRSFKVIKLLGEG